MMKDSTRTKHWARVLIVDDHETFGQKCRHFLESRFDVAGLVRDGSDLVQAVAELKPHVLITDVSVPRSSGFALAEQAKAIRPELKIIYMTGAPDFDGAEAAMQLGGSAYINKMRFPEELFVAMSCVLRGDLYLTRRLIPPMNVHQSPHYPPLPLSRHPRSR